MLSFQTITFVLGSHFNCPPHMWDDQPVDRVYLDYLMVRVNQEQQTEEMKKARKEAERYNAGGNRNKGRPLRTTSDSANLDDFFERFNQQLSEQDGE
tara:strand:- start:2549 stop:2839 length:291 start_codon:yes stop_codon:yes gene_type:complete